MAFKVAISQIGGKGWTGGITYRNNLVKAVLEHLPEIELFLLVESLNILEEIDPRVRRIELIRSKNIIKKNYEKLLKKVLNYDLELKRTVDSISADVVFPTTWFIGKGIGRVFWYPDFQFMHLPHMYSKSQLKIMGPKLRISFKNATIILLSSLDAQKDFKKFAPEFLHKTRVMNFVAHVPEKLLNTDCTEVIRAYNLPTEFVYLPNQLWAHKNHLVVLESLALLNKQGFEVSLVMTGNLTDRRNPSYINHFFFKLASLGLNKQVYCLGMVPHEHVYALIRQSKFVLNPSLFEGWSTTVEETKSVGKSMLLSDLDVHKEQNPPNSEYFLPNDSNDLALKLKKMWQRTLSGPDLAMESHAALTQRKRMKIFAENFITICKEAKELAK